MFGLRHAFAAIDNVVRKLMQDGKAPYSVGFFFSLGHSTMSFWLRLRLPMAAAMQGNLAERDQVKAEVAAERGSLPGAEL